MASICRPTYYWYATLPEYLSHSINEQFFKQWSAAELVIDVREASLLNNLKVCNRPGADVLSEIGKYKLLTIFKCEKRRQHKDQTSIAGIIVEMTDLQDRFASKIASSIKLAWDEIAIHYEHIDVDGHPREVFTSSLFLHGKKQSFLLPLEAVDILSTMKEQRPLGQIASWTWLEFFMDKTGKYKFDYKYDRLPPLILEQINNSK